MVSVPIERLERSAGDQYGETRVRGTTVTVHEIVLQHQIDRMPPEEIAVTFEIGLADVYTALAYYYDNQAVIDQEMAENEAAYDAEAARHPSALRDKLQRLGLTYADVARYIQSGDQAALAKIRSGERPRNE